MLNPVTAHVKLIQCDHILGEVVTHPVIDAKLTGYGIFRGQQIRHLDIQLVALIFTNEVDLLVACLADSHRIAPAKKLHVDDIFQNQVNIPHADGDTDRPSLFRYLEMAVEEKVVPIPPVT